MTRTLRKVVGRVVPVSLILVRSTRRELSGREVERVFQTARDWLQTARHQASSVHAFNLYQLDLPIPN